jgi:3-deoxy-manno-octulosonate cytidylyltransferase (CMP-KDO synthetase)
MGSSRFPGKPLATIAGRPMIEHVYRRTAACPALDEVIVATCDDEIARRATDFGAKVVITSRDHQRASDRVAEVSARDDAAIVVMIQGDEPMIEPGMISAVTTPLLDDLSCGCTNLMAPIVSEAEFGDRNTIKVVTDLHRRALYFSRAPIPSSGPAPSIAGNCFKQVCVIGFRRETLQQFATLPQGRLERIESVDMLRLLEHGIAIQMVPTDVETHAVDTPADLVLVEAMMQPLEQPR